MQNRDGERYGRWGVIGTAGRDRNYEVKYLCRCVCGVEKPVVWSSLRRGLSTSCGCYNREMSMQKNTTHGRSGSRVQRAYYAMMARCYDRDCDGYEDYGGRGIAVCKRWRESFAAFIEDMGDPPPGTSLDRRDNDKGYSKGNCRGATTTQQANNTRRNVRVEYDGRTQTVAEWARETGMQYETLSARLRMGWSPQDALTRPVQQKRPRLTKTH